MDARRSEITEEMLICDNYLLLIRFGHLEVVQFLIKGKHCKPDAVNKDGSTALHYAAR